MFIFPMANSIEARTSSGELSSITITSKFSFGKSCWQYVSMLLFSRWLVAHTHITSEAFILLVSEIQCSSLIFISGLSLKFFIYYLLFDVWVLVYHSFFF